MSEIIKPNMIVICGISGSGKTTFAKKIAELSNYRYLSPDNFYEAVNGSAKIHENKFEVWMNLFRAIRICEEQGINCIIDSNFPTQCDREQLIRWFPNFKHNLIYIKTDPKTCIARNKLRDRVIPEEQMNEIINSFKSPENDTCIKDWDSFIIIDATNKGINNDSLYLDSLIEMFKSSKLI
ncbi:MAG: ATP-binding protein [Lachnospiraceae bacterium]|nr:ATP-binding protein [Lachnospiraceae bacterium]